MFRPTRDSDDFAAEVASHLRLEEDRLLDEGRGANEARAAARRAFGNVTLSTERFYESHRWLWWDRLAQDVRSTVRSWRAARGLTLVAALTIAIGIGASTAMFSVIDATLLHSLPYPHPDRLVSVIDDLPGIASYDVGVSQPEWLDLDRSGIFESVALYWFDENNLTGPPRPATVRLMSVTPNYFAVLGVAPQLGRAFRAGNRSPGYLEEVVISDGLWKRDFGGDPRVLEKSLRLDTDLYRIVGVMPPAFRAPGRTVDERNVDVWAATNFYGPPLPYQPPRRVRNIPGVIARLPREAGIESAQGRIDALVADLQRHYPDDYPGAARWAIRLLPLHDDVVGGVRRPLILMMGAVALVLVIGCVNVANLLLARASTRRREFAMRQAIGAGAARLMRQLLTESLCLSVVGGAAGIALLYAVEASLVRMIPEGLPRLNDISLNWTVLAFAAAATFASGAVFGLAPAIDARRRDLLPALQTSIRGSSSRGHARTRSALVVSECALSIVLMIAAGLLLRSFQHLVAAPLGFDPAGVTTIRTRLPYPNDVTIDKYPTPEKEAPLLRAVLAQARAIPGVELAAIGSSSAIPLDHAHRDVNTMPFLVEGRGVDSAHAPLVSGSVVTPEYFPLLRLTLVRGRLFTDADTETTTAVAVVNESMARTFWAGADPIGAHVKLSRSATAPWTTIVGIVADARTEMLADAGVPQVYASAFQKTAKHLAVFLRGRVDTAAAAERVRGIVQTLDPALPVFGAQTLTDAVSGSLAARRFAMRIVALFAAAALLLAMLGIYGVMSYSVTARTQEIGIRLALGAPPERMLADVAARGLALACAGTIAGLVCAAAVGRLMAGLLYGVRPLDPMTFAGVPISMIAVAALACWIPARRALRIDPLQALRCDG